MKAILTILLLLASVIPSAATSFEELRSLSTCQALPAGSTLKGIVISDYRSYNAETNPNTAWDKVDISLSLRTFYLQSEDGRYGFRVVLDRLYDNRFERGDQLELELEGARLLRGEEPLNFTIEKPKGIKLLSRGNAIAPKKRSIAELSDYDLYTLVTVTDLEYLNKEGSFLNINELCAQKSRINRCDSPISCADSWASLLLDSKGDHIYLQLNSKVDWRRNVLDFPKGRGEVTGVLVCSQNRRYGSSFGRYSLRPVFRQDIALETPEETAFSCIASWRWDRNYHQELNFVQAGAKRWLGRKEICNDAVLAEQGKGLLYTTGGAYYSLDGEYDARHATDGSGTGSRAAAALRLDCTSSDWYVYSQGRLAGINSIIVETSTMGFEGNGVLLNFSMLAGNRSLKTSFGYPAFWTLSYSTDGRKWLPAGLTFQLRPIIYKRDIHDNRFCPPSYDAAMGFPEFSVKLPAELLGKEKVWFRIAPANEILTEVHSDPELPISSGKMVPGYEQPHCIHIGMLEIKAY